MQNRKGYIHRELFDRIDGTVREEKLYTNINLQRQFGMTPTEYRQTAAKACWSAPSAINPKYRTP